MKAADRLWLSRYQLARELFIESTGVTWPDLQAALWNNLNPDDRQYWLDQADALKAAADNP